MENPVTAAQALAEPAICSLHALMAGGYQRDGCPQGLHNQTTFGGLI